MCPSAALAAASFVIGAAQQVVGFMGQQQQYDAQAEAYKQNALNAQAAARDEYASTQNRLLQEREAAVQERTEASIEALSARSTARTAAGEAGVSGLSVDALLADYYAKEGRNSASIENNLSATQNYLIGEMDSIEARTQSQINSVPIPTPPSFLPTAVGIFSSGLEAFRIYDANTRDVS